MYIFLIWVYVMPSGPGAEFSHFRNLLVISFTVNGYVLIGFLDFAISFIKDVSSGLVIDVAP